MQHPKNPQIQPESFPSKAAEFLPENTSFSLLGWARKYCKKVHNHEYLKRDISLTNYSSHNFNTINKQ